MTRAVDDDLKTAVADYLTTGDLAPLRALVGAGSAPAVAVPKADSDPVPKADSSGLGWSRRGRRVFVHYPGRDRHGAGLEVDWPFRFPDGNEATRERVLLVESLEDAGANAPGVQDS